MPLHISPKQMLMMYQKAYHQSFIRSLNITLIGGITLFALNSLLTAFWLKDSEYTIAPFILIGALVYMLLSLRKLHHIKKDKHAQSQFIETVFTKQLAVSKIESIQFTGRLLDMETKTVQTDVHEFVYHYSELPDLTIQSLSTDDAFYFENQPTYHIQSPNSPPYTINNTGGSLFMHIALQVLNKQKILTVQTIPN